MGGRPNLARDRNAAAPPRHRAALCVPPQAGQKERNAGAPPPHCRLLVGTKAQQRQQCVCALHSAQARARAALPSPPHRHRHHQLDDDDRANERARNALCCEMSCRSVRFSSSHQNGAALFFPSPQFKRILLGSCGEFPGNFSRPLCTIFAPPILARFSQNTN